MITTSGSWFYNWPSPGERSDGVRFPGVSIYQGLITEHIPQERVDSPCPGVRVCAGLRTRNLCGSFPKGVSFVVTASTPTAAGLIGRICEKAFIKKNYSVNHIQIWTHGAEDLVTCRHVYWSAHGSDALIHYLISGAEPSPQPVKAGRHPGVAQPNSQSHSGDPGSSNRLEGTEL